MSESNEGNQISLLEISLNALGQNIEKISTLEGISEDLACALFQDVLERGKLTPRVLKLFAATDHSLLTSRIESLKIKDLPAIVPITRNPWLGDKPGLF